MKRPPSRQADSGNDALRRYIARANKYRSVDREHERELFRRFQMEGNREAGEELARAHLRYPVALALKYRGYGLPVPELIAEGNAGMAVALVRFDSERGVRFATYAVYWIRAYMIDYILRAQSIASGGHGAFRSREFFRLRRERACVTSRLGVGEDAEQQLSERLGVTRDRLSALLQQLDRHDVDIDARQGYGGTPEPLVVTQTAEMLLEAHDRHAWEIRAIRCAMTDLDDRDRYIVERRLMAPPEEELTLAEIGRKLGVSRERARQLETRVKRRLRERMTALSGRDAA